MRRYRDKGAYTNIFSYDLDLFWGDGNSAAPQGKLGYLMGLRALDYSYAEIASRIQPRWTMNWTQLTYLKKKEEPLEVAATKAVEIAVITNHEYAEYAGKTSLCAPSLQWASRVANRTSGCTLTPELTISFRNG